jgi:hypothetical protein
LTLKTAASKQRSKESNYDCGQPGNVLLNICKRIEFDKIPPWTTFLIKNYILNTLENVKDTDWN